MPRSSIAIVLSLGLVLTAACGGGPPPAPPGPAPLAPLDAADRLYSDNGEGITDSVRIVVRDAATLRDVWTRATRHQASPAPAPAVDFEEHMVLVVGAGRMTPQDRIRVDSVGIREVPDALGNPRRTFLVMVRTIQGCQQLDLDAYPVEIVRVPRFDGPVRFSGRLERDPNCQLGAEPVPSGTAGSAAGGAPHPEGPGHPTGPARTARPTPI